MEAKFTWDATKNASNLLKHGINFEIAMRVFADPKVAVVFSRAERGEDRYKAIGRVQLGSRSAWITVVFSLPNELETRIISARAAREIERRLYG